MQHLDVEASLVPIYQVINLDLYNPTGIGLIHSKI